MASELASLTEQIGLKSDKTTNQLAQSAIRSYTARMVAHASGQPIRRSIGLFSRGARIVLSALWFISFGTKAAAFGEFCAVIAGSKLEIPDFLVSIVAYAVLATEFLCGLGVLFRRLSGPLYLGAGLAGVFVGYNIWRVVANVQVPCRCFGTIFQFSPFEMITLDIFIVGASVALLAADAPLLKRTVTLRETK